jgi:hypothetical protein
LLVETLPVHVLVAHFSPVAAWILSGASIYSLLWLIGDYQGLRLRPCRIDDDLLLVRLGLRWSVRVPLAAIAEVRAIRARPAGRDRGYLHATLIGDPTVLVELREPVRAIGPYGWRRLVHRIGLAPDDREGFLAALPPGVLC